ncbi:glycosyl hydrolase family 18 protein [Bacillus sp. B1-b2]|uniref:glycosyl hydrolase family 18 protein n=1 Tax=Bacillus sp. B1-b2 TaxID=2653201 RepID=UPI0012614608|nr:glycosyl hydrolase family 18 protein [Bacillus sp. B1-b2]KAB7671274.1 peptidoglycan hydrolase [Bacillus sp. B1-b2]
MTEINYNINKKNKKKPIIIGLIIAILLIVSSVIMLLYPFANNTKIDYFEGEKPVFYNGEQIGNALYQNNTLYLPLSVWQEEIDESITYDSESNSVIVTTMDKVIQLPTDSLSYYVNNEVLELSFHPMTDNNGEVYVALDPLVSFYPIQVTQIGDHDVILLEEDGQERTSATFTSEEIREDYSRLRAGANLSSPYTGELQQNEQVTIEKEVEDYYFVRKESGVAGFIQKKFINKGTKETVSVTLDQKEPSLNKINGPIQLTWEAVYSRNPDTSNIPNMAGVNVVSPTWFKLSGTNGDVSNLGSTAYVDWAHSKGYQVWALFSNDFNPELTHEVLSSYNKRQNVIRQLLVYSEMYQLDGINIDIENVEEEDGQYVTQFVRELTPYLHQAGITVSMDITFVAEGNYSAFFEREHLADIVDYLVVMAYDEHWATSPTAGSVASIPWVETNLDSLLEMIPNEKLVLGVPLYARLWEENENGELSSQALSMDQVEEWLQEKNVTPTYDEASGQNYGEYYDPETNSTYKIWLEDETSLSKRVELVDKYGLAGVASWSRSFANEEAWVALSLETEEE